MTPLPAKLEPGAPLVVWRIDSQRYASSWASGLGAEAVGGRWNPKGRKAVYCSIDPSTCLVESAVHRGFKVLDSQPHVLTSLEILDVLAVRVVRREEVPNPAWLEGGMPSSHQQHWGAELLEDHGIVVFPSSVSKRSWSVVIHPMAAAGRFQMRAQERLSVDTRLTLAM
jgi:RES domain-containing protein